ncbi:MAG TPA: hypothetical protein VFT12_08875 [Thermoanaerobaculia bacterium]|nr:hypothetical protein [Thermoanaerobaculia bacterium]
MLMLAILTASCATAPAPDLWSELQSMCGRAYEGRLVEGTEPSDAELGRQRLVMHVRSCSPAEIRIPFHVGENRSRTWVITRTGSGLRLKHDHRHEDGSEDRITQYGGDSAGTQALRVDFPADAFTAELLPAAATNVWTMEIDPSRSFTYALHRANRRFRVEFDLTRPVAPPPPPW